jgi:hypothetical protein
MSTSDSPNKRAVIALKKVEGNEVCADCGQNGKCLVSLSLMLWLDKAKLGLVCFTTSATEGSRLSKP